MKKEEHAAPAIIWIFRWIMWWRCQCKDQLYHQFVFFFHVMLQKGLIPATFVVGHNRSKPIFACMYTQILTYTQSDLGGKSAALFALTVTLGREANSTSQGSGIKSFIHKGQRFFHPSPPFPTPTPLQCFRTNIPPWKPRQRSVQVLQVWQDHCCHLLVQERGWVFLEDQESGWEDN